MDKYSSDYVNQITLNCLISKSQLMKINNTKIKKNLNVERNKKIKKYHSQLLELFEKLLNKSEPSDLFDDVKSSYIHFIDKIIIYLDNINADDLIEEQKEEKEQKEDIQEDNLLNNKINDMMNRCYDDKYNEMITTEEHDQCQEEDQEIYDDDEDDENDEY